MNDVFEVNFDTLVGPTHNFSGLSLDNLASHENIGKPSNPKEAALQGLRKMKLISDLGIKQAVLPPQQRPSIHALEQLGFTGSEEFILKKSSEQSPRLLSDCSSSAYMWTANSATCAPSRDTLDGKFHITPANLINEFHRTIETQDRAHLLKHLFSNSNFFTVHSPLKSSLTLADEGAANHTRLCPKHSYQGLHFFVYGRSDIKNDTPHPTRFYPRQSLEASQAIARFHKIPPSHTFFAQQNPEVIDAGVFHNDVICVGNENILLYHEKAFVNTEEVIKNLKELYSSLFNQPLLCIEVPETKVSLREAVRTYLFNSQLVTIGNNKKTLIVPMECQESLAVKSFLKDLLQNYPEIESVKNIELRESMMNGGGPACLRLRAVLTKEELQALPSSIFLTDRLYNSLSECINKYYRDLLYPSDLSQMSLLNESRIALQKLNEILNLHF
ncbi:MAG: N-succinylarginine dihydrolase [Verrucomicrobia bacterium]|nr:MAG: N-succinylarginine dihydrolase [Verrucomicrobiota bacterium]